MFRWFRRPSYDLLIEPERITLGDGTVRVQVEPRVAVAESGRVLAVGGRAKERSGRVLELLGPASAAERPRFEERWLGFVALFRHLIHAAQNNSMFAVRPFVRVHGASVLAPLLEGREERFLLDALMNAGATKVEFAP